MSFYFISQVVSLLNYPTLSTKFDSLGLLRFVDLPRRHNETDHYIKSITWLVKIYKIFRPKIRPS